MRRGRRLVRRGTRRIVSHALRLGLVLSLLCTPGASVAPLARDLGMGGLGLAAAGAAALSAALAVAHARAVVASAADLGTVPPAPFPDDAAAEPGDLGGLSGLSSQAEAAENPWDPQQPAPLLLADGSWGLGFLVPSGVPNGGMALRFRRGLATGSGSGGGKALWLAAVTVESQGVDQPSLVQVGSTLGLVYRKAVGSPAVVQVMVRTSADNGATWSAAVQISSETANVLAARAVTDGGTAYALWTTTGSSTLAYASSSSLTSWSGGGSVGEPVSGGFTIARTGGGWLLAWLAPSLVGSAVTPPGDPDHPVLWAGTLGSLGSAASNKRELTDAWVERGVNSVGVGSIGSTLVVGYSHYDGVGNHLGWVRTSADGGASWTPKLAAFHDPLHPPGGVIEVGGVALVPSGGGLRAFWHQTMVVASNPALAYDYTLYYREVAAGPTLGSVWIVPPTDVDWLSLCGGCHPWASDAADPVVVPTGQFYLPATDVAIPGRGPGLAFGRTYNSANATNAINASSSPDGPLGHGWALSYDARLQVYPGGEVVVVTGSGRHDLYQPSGGGGGGGYTPPAGRYGALVHQPNGTWTLTDRAQITQTFSAPSGSPPSGTPGRLLSIADRNGNTTSLTYDGSGKLTGVTAAGGRGLTIAYSGNRISSVTDPLGRVVSYGYNGAGNLVTVTDQRGKVWSYSYDASHLLTQATDPLGHHPFTNVYGRAAQVLRQTDAGGGITSFTYGAGSTVVTDPLGRATVHDFDTSYRVTRITDPAGKLVTFAYDASFNITQVNDQRRTPGGPANVTALTYDANGNLLTRANGLGKVWSWSYNARNDVTVATDPLGHSTAYSYNAAGNLIAVTNAKGEITTLAPNAQGLVASVTDARGKTTALAYDAHGGMVGITNPLGKSWSAAYDAAGRTQSVTDPLGHVTSLSYDATDNLLVATDARGQTASAAYDDAGRRISVTDPNGRVTGYAFDARDRLVSVTDAAGGVTAYGYDAADQLLTVTDAEGHVRSWSYDALGRPLTEQDAANQTITYEYDGAGNRTKRTMPNGEQTVYSYDTIGRLTGVDEPSGTADVSYTYDDANRQVSLVDGIGTTTYAYDQLDRPTSVTQPGTAAHPGNKTVSYQYDAAGNRTRITYPDGKQVNYAYDDASRLSSVTDWLSKATSYGYDDAGRLTTTRFPTQVVERRTYNAADQLTSIASTKTVGAVTTVLAGASYELDATGIRKAASRATGREEYAYDKLYRITGVRYGDGSTQTYAYDRVGNRTGRASTGPTAPPSPVPPTPSHHTHAAATGGTINSKPAERPDGPLTLPQQDIPPTDRSPLTLPAPPSNYVYDAADRIVSASGVSFTHDAKGNMLSRGADTFQWDAENRLVQATVAGTVSTNQYRGDGLRHTQTAGGQTATYTWDLGSGLPNVLQDGTNTYVYGHGVISETNISGVQT
ncbi:MAG: DUF6531 domain-containing protein [Chloroflexota bacterium]